MIGVEQEYVFFRLPASIQHHHVPAARGAAPAKLFRFIDKHRKLARYGVLRAG